MSLGVAGCGSEDDARLVVVGNVRPDGACQYDSSGSAPLYDVGYLDLAFGRPYVAHLLVENEGSDPVDVDGGYRNVWYEPSHTVMIQGTGHAARGGFLTEGHVSIPAGGSRIVAVDLLGDGFTVYKRDFEQIVMNGQNPALIEQESSVRIVVEGDADGTRVRSEGWDFGITISLGSLVDADPAADSPSMPGFDCCGRISGSRCEAGLNYNLGSCAECASCWPEVCNNSIGPSQCQPPLPACGS